MHLTRIEIENFKSIGERQSIEFRPITLLFGPNSAGKSTILQALHYLREVLERGNLNPDKTASGGLMNLGGFRNLVYNYDLKKPITIKVVLESSSFQEIGKRMLPADTMPDQLPDDVLPLVYLHDEGREDQFPFSVSIGLEVKILWSDGYRSPYVQRLAIELNNEHLAAIVSPSGEEAQLTDFNFEHPLLQASRSSTAHYDGDGSPLEKKIRDMSDEDEQDEPNPLAPDDDQAYLWVITRSGALPWLDQDLILDFEPDDANLTDQADRLRYLLSAMVVGPAQLTLDYLVDMTYIGPLRQIPPRGYRPQMTPEAARWAEGLAAWDLLHRDRTDQLMQKVNTWLSGAEHLATGYQLERIEFVQLPDTMQQMLERGLNEEDMNELQNLYNSLAARTEIGLRDIERDITVAPDDVGVGISQMIPVVTAALREQGGLLAIEQPELHLHPAIQVKMGDLFIHAATAELDSEARRTFLIETHSEHLMLRLLRRVREQSEDELPEGVLGISPDDLAVVCIENRPDGTRFRSIKVTPDGDFEDRWPQGFFHERADELF